MINKSSRQHFYIKQILASCTGYDNLPISHFPVFFKLRHMKVKILTTKLHLEKETFLEVRNSRRNPKAGTVVHGRVLLTGLLLRGLVNLPSYTTQYYLSRDGMAPTGLGPPIPIIVKKKLYRLAYNLIQAPS